MENRFGLLHLVLHLNSSFLQTEMARWANLDCMENTLSPEFPLPITPAIVAFLLLALGKALGSEGCCPAVH